MSRFLERALFACGAGLLVFLIYKLGASNVVDDLRLVGWGIIPSIGQEIFAYTFNTLGWRASFAPPRPVIPFRRMLAARMAGDSVNYLTPTAQIGGEFVRLRFLQGAAPDNKIIAAMTVAKLAQTTGQVIFIISGLLWVLPSTPLPDSIKRGLFIALSIIATFAALFMVAQRRGLFRVLSRLGEIVGLKFSAAFRETIENLDAEIRSFHVDSPGSLALAISCYIAGWMMGVVEIYLLLWFLGIDATIKTALTIEVLSSTIDGAMFFVPAKVGTQEGGKVLIFTALGLDPAKGLAVGILRHLRELTWSSIGVLLWWREQNRTPSPLTVQRQRDER